MKRPQNNVNLEVSKEQLVLVEGLQNVGRAVLLDLPLNVLNLLLHALDLLLHVLDLLIHGTVLLLRLIINIYNPKNKGNERF